MTNETIKQDYSIIRIENQEPIAEGIETLKEAQQFLKERFKGQESFEYCIVKNYERIMTENGGGVFKATYIKPHKRRPRKLTIEELQEIRDILMKSTADNELKERFNKQVKFKEWKQSTKQFESSRVEGGREIEI